MKIILTESQAMLLAEDLCEIDKEANAADINPTEKQKEAGNYKMGHLNFGGFQISIENPRGSRRYFKAPEGEKNYVVMKNHYGYFTKTKGYDGDQVDVFLGPDKGFENVYVVDQNNEKGEFDESKVMLGFSSKDEAKAAYSANFSDDWKGFGHITGVPKDIFKKWLYTGRKQKKAFYKYNLVKNNLSESIDEDMAYHGSEADFDKFDFAYMGTGAGAQAWAYGTYLSRGREGGEIYGRNLYKVEFPDDDGNNYIMAQEDVKPDDANAAKDALYNYIIEKEPESYGSDMARREFYDELNQAFGAYMDGNSLYGTISSYLGSDKEASEFCYSNLGKIGFKYTDKGNENIVIFNPDDIKIVEKNPGKDQSSNGQLNKAKENKNDEFYTRTDSIASELSNYSDRLRGKVVFCNCDNPEFSNFYAYLKENFRVFGLKMLVSTGLGQDGKGKYGLFDGKNEETGDLEGDGSFNSPESRNYLSHSDVVISNPPFTLFREYLDMLISSGKDFIVLGNMNAVKNKDTYRYFLEGKVRTGYTGFNNGMYFNVPEGFEYSAGYRGKKEIGGQKVARVSGISWFTNMFDEKPVSEVVLKNTTSTAKYEKYDNYDAIEVKPYTNIPYDYEGYMGVPVTIMDKLGPDGMFHFRDPEGNELLYKPFGLMNSGEKNEGIRYPGSKSGKPIINGKFIYSRILIHKV